MNEPIQYEEFYAIPEGKANLEEMFKVGDFFLARFSPGNSSWYGPYIVSGIFGNILKVNGSETLRNSPIYEVKFIRRPNRIVKYNKDQQQDDDEDI